MYTEAEATFESKNNAQPIFKLKRHVPFASREIIEKELHHLEKNWVLSKNDCSARASPTENNEIRVCADYSTGLNDSLKTYNYPLTSSEKIFAKLNGGKIS